MEGKEATAQPLALDWSCSDLLLEIRGDAPSQSFGSSGRSGQSGHGSRGLRVGTSTPVWALGRGVSPAYQGRHRWKLRVLRLAKDSSESAASPESPPPPPPSLLFGVLAQFPGARPMPSAALGDPAGEGVESEEPALALLADTGDQLFSSNLSATLLRAPLLSGPLKEADLIEITHDLDRQSLRFRVEGGAEGEAKRLPLRRAGRGTHASQRLRETAYYPFIAIRAGAEVELLALYNASRTHAGSFSLWLMDVSSVGDGDVV
ncbi:unnamed protein product [Symbiodinium natans]|uniref:Uncharacterized protein n=1 Tax=Symbiodinium natans TaxID=878477 RepID=A0A812L9T0_9DINO|nr:unnamed protein product [Symbiodinium natans]